LFKIGRYEGVEPSTHTIQVLGTYVRPRHNALLTVGLYKAYTVEPCSSQ